MKQTIKWEADISVCDRLVLQGSGCGWLIAVSCKTLYANTHNMHDHAKTYVVHLLYLMCMV
jgi:hypothetical protein